MPLESQIILVRDARTKMHALLRIMPLSEIDKPRSAVDIETLNNLMMAKTPLALIMAVERIGPLYSFTSDLKKGKDKTRLLYPSEVQTLIDEGTLTPGIPDELIRQLVFDPFFRLNGDSEAFERVGRKPTSDAKEAVNTYCPTGIESSLFLNTGGYVFQYEPLQDWILIRNLFSIAMRLAGTARLQGSLKDNESGEMYLQENILTDAGFVNAERTGIHSWLSRDTANAFVIPILFNTFFREGSVLKNELANQEELINPLMEAIAPYSSKYAGLKNVRTMQVTNEAKPDELPILVLTAASASISKASIKSRDARIEEDPNNLWMYLTLQGDDQAKLSDSYLNTLNSLFGRGILNYSNSSLEGITIGYRNAACALWATIVSHQKYYPLTCKNCKRTVLSTTQGAGREFCSDVCRAAYNKAHKQATSK